MYSIVLMDDVVAAVDRLAYAAGTSRSNMINRILAEAVSMSTPEQQMQDIFSVITDVLGRQSMLQPMLSASDAMLSLRSALQYKYNPSVKYAVELYPHPGAAFGELRASLRTQNPTLLLYLSQFYKLWSKLETASLEGTARTYEISAGRFTRVLCMPQEDISADTLGNAIASYVSLFDMCLKAFFEHTENAAAATTAVSRLYRENLDSLTAQL